MRASSLPAVLQPEHLPTPPAVALRVVDATRDPHCQVGEVTRLLSLDAALSSKLLQVANSSLFGRRRPVLSLAKAVDLLGLNAVRALTLGLSLPALVSGPPEPWLHEFWTSSIGGAIIARELAVRARRPPDDVFAASLFRDVGYVLLRRAHTTDWPLKLSGRTSAQVTDQCSAEREAFGADHAEIGADLLRLWNLPVGLSELVRHHHQRPEPGPDCAPGSVTDAELVWVADQLIQLDTIADLPEVLEPLLAVVRYRFGLSISGLSDLLATCVPRIDDFSSALAIDLGGRPDLAAVLADGAAALADLTIENRALGVARGDISPPLSGPPSGSVMKQRPYPKTPIAGYDLMRTRLAAGSRIGEYEVRCELGRGGMGVVYRALDATLARDVAIKVIAPAHTRSQDARRRFAREARVAASVCHAHIVRVYAVGECRGRVFIVMEYVPGESLAHRIGRDGPLPLPLAARLGCGLASGLATLHARGIAHRDIKPANVLVGAETEAAKLSDFGLAQAVGDEPLTVTGDLLGTPGFIPPECLEGQTAGPSGDLFSLGAVLYETVTGRAPFLRDSVAETLRAVRVPPIPPQRIRSNTPGWLNSLIMRMLAPHPVHRPTADQAFRALEQGHETLAADV